MGQKAKPSKAKTSRKDFSSDADDFDNIIFACFGREGDMDLPQVADENGTIVDLVHNMTGESYELIEAQLHQQIDPSWAA
jgi:hypothetical protein